MTEAQKKSKREYDKKNTKTFCIKLNYNTDADLISLLESVDNVQGFIKGALNREITKMAGTCIKISEVEE